MSDTRGNRAHDPYYFSLTCVVSFFLLYRLKVPPPPRVPVTLARGKVTRAVLEDVFGSNLLAAVQAAFREQEELSASMRRDRARRRKARRNVADSGEGAHDGNAGEKKEEEEEEDEDGRREYDLVEQLAGSDAAPGELQV